MAKRAKQSAMATNLQEILEANALQAPAGYTLYVVRVDDMDAGALRNVWDIARSRTAGPSAIVLGCDNEGTPLLMAAASDDAVAAGFNAGDLIKQISGHIKGGGGGKPAMAQAGGKDASGLEAALDAARQLLL